MKAAIVVLALVLLIVFPVSQVHATNPTDIAILGFSWSHPRVNVVLYNSTTDSNLFPYAVAGIESWYQAINGFASNYSHYDYLRQLYFPVYVGGVNDSGIQPDVSVYFVNSIPGCPKCLGLTTYWYSLQSGEPTQMTIQVKDSLSTSAKGVIAHEFGHALGLGHAPSNDACLPYPVDLMSSCSISTLLPSSLDVYALGVVYAWLLSGTYSPVQQGTVSLPSDIPYASIHDLRYYQDQLSSDQSQITDLSRDVIDLSAKNIKLQYQNEELNVTLTLLRSQIASFQSEISSLQSQLSASQSNNTELASRLSLAEQELSSLQAQASALQSDLLASNQAFESQRQTSTYLEYGVAILLVAFAVSAAIAVRRGRAKSTG